MLLLAGAGCALVCFAAGLATASGSGDRRVAAGLVAAQVAGGAVLGWLTGWLLNLTPAETAALALVGAAPGTIGANPLAAVSGGNLTLAHATTALGVFAAVLAATVVAALAGAGGPLVWLVLGAALPAWAGSALRGRVAAQVQRLVTVLAGLALFGMIVAGLALGRAGATLWPLAGGALVLALALAVLGNALGRALPGGEATTVTAMLILPMRNVAVPMLAGLAAGLTAAPLAAAVYGVVMYLPALAVVFTRAARSRR